MRLPAHGLILLLWTAWGAVTAFAAEPVAPLATGVEIVRAEFGLINPPESGKPLFVPTRVVPLTPTQAYGWVMLVRTDKPRIKWREEFSLPVKPATWGDPPPSSGVLLSPDGRVSVTEREVATDRGVIGNSWSVAPGDPKGRYVIRVFIEGSLAREFAFDAQ